MLVGKQEEIEILVGFDERVDDKEGVVGRDVVVHGAVGKQEVAFQIFGHVLIGLVVVVGGAVRIFHEQALVAFAPVVFILAIIVVARLGNSHLEKIGITKHGVGSGVAAAGMAVDSSAVDIDPGIFRGGFFHSRDLVR